MVDWRGKDSQRSVGYTGWQRWYESDGHVLKYLYLSCTFTQVKHVWRLQWLDTLKVLLFNGAVGCNGCKQDANQIQSSGQNGSILNSCMDMVFSIILENVVGGHVPHVSSEGLSLAITTGGLVPHLITIGGLIPHPAAIGGLILHLITIGGLIPHLSTIGGLIPHHYELRSWPSEITVQHYRLPITIWGLIPQHYDWRTYPSVLRVGGLIPLHYDLRTYPSQLAFRHYCLLNTIGGQDFSSRRRVRRDPKVW
jgi:hypothetical protein